MNAIDKIKARLAPYADVRYSERENEIEVHPRDPSGFTVALRITAAGFTVYFDGWHEEFESEDEAVNCFGFGLSPSCRLAVTLRGNGETSWTVEGLQDGVWTTDSKTTLLVQPFWRPARIEYRQNHVLNAPRQDD